MMDNDWDKAIPQAQCSYKEGLRRLTVHQLFPFFDLGLVVTKLSGDDLHSTGDLFPQASLALNFSATLATTGPFDARKAFGLVKCTGGLVRFGGGDLRFGSGGLRFRSDGLRFGFYGLGWKVLCSYEQKDLS